MRLPSPSANRRLRASSSPVDLRKARKGFSLVEILTVLAIISLMALVGLPSISSMSQSGSLTAGGNDLADLAVMAHDYAVSHNVMTALVGVTSATSVPSAAQYRAFIVLAGNLNPAGTYTWSPVSKWVFLPSAVTMSSYASLNTFQTFKGAYPPQNVSLNLDGANVTSGYAYQTFYPDGHMDTSASSVVLHLVTNQNKTTKTDPKDYYDLVFNPMTGTVKINRP